VSLLLSTAKAIRSILGGLFFAVSLCQNSGSLISPLFLKKSELDNGGIVFAVDSKSDTLF
jgi:hypothetical protein